MMALSDGVVIILVITLIAVFPAWPYSRNWGYLPSAGRERSFADPVDRVGGENRLIQRSSPEGTAEEVNGDTVLNPGTANPAALKRKLIWDVFSKHQQNRHPERSASQIYRVTQHSMARSRRTPRMPISTHAARSFSTTEACAFQLRNEGVPVRT